jgi:hypothetical protein
MNKEEKIMFLTNEIKRLEDSKQKNSQEFFIIREQIELYKSALSKMIKENEQ